jgi:quercetin dioxygenase-like cupin family protein
MNIVTREEVLQGEPVDPSLSSHFTGPSTSRRLYGTSEPHSVWVTVVRFEAGVRNHWHTHAGGQVLHVVEGEGYVQARGEPPRRISMEDSVSIMPGEEHWHGAGPNSPMAHVAISIGDITWLEPSELDLA